MVDRLGDSYACFTTESDHNYVLHQVTEHPAVGDLLSVSVSVWLKMTLSYKVTVGACYWFLKQPGKHRERKKKQTSENNSMSLVFTRDMCQVCLKVIKSLEGTSSTTAVTTIGALSSAGKPLKFLRLLSLVMWASLWSWTRAPHSRDAMPLSIDWA